VNPTSRPSTCLLELIPTDSVITHGRSGSDTSLDDELHWWTGSVTSMNPSQEAQDAVVITKSSGKLLLDVGVFR